MSRFMLKIWLAAASVLVGVIVGWPSTVHADDCTWIGGTGDWHVAGNWSCGFVPDGDDTAIINSDTVNVDSGVTVLGLVQSGGTLTGAYDIIVTGAFSWTGGTQAGTGTTTVAASAGFDLGGGTKTLDGRTLNNQGVASWTAGQINLKNAATVDNSGVFDVEGDFHLNQGGGDLSTFHNSGTLRKVGAAGTTDVEVHFNNSGSVEVLGGTLSLGYTNSVGSSSGSFSVGTGATLRFRYGSQALTSSSSVSGGGRVWVSGGSVSVSGIHDFSGSTEVSGGTVNFEPSANVVDIGEALIISGGTADLNSGEAVSPTTLEQSGGILTGSDSLTATSGFSWTGGTQGGTGATTVAATATFGLSGGTKTLDGRTLNNQTLASWTAGQINLENAATVDNSGVFDVVGDFHLNKGSGEISTFANSGTLRKVGAAGTTEVEMHFNNSGSVEVLSGTLALGYTGSAGSSSGSFSVGTGATLRFRYGSQALTSSSSVSGWGRVWVSGGSVSVSGMYDLSGSTEVSGGTMNFEPSASVVDIGEALIISGGTADLTSGEAVSPAMLEQSGGILTGNDSLTPISGFSWTGGTQSGTGTTTVPATATFDLSGGTKTLDMRQLYNQGMAFWTEGTVNVKNGALIENSGTFEVQCDYHLNQAGGALSVLNNSGTLRKVGADGATEVEMHFNNTGSVEVLSGTLALGYTGSVGSSSGSFSMDAEATLRFRYGSQELASGSSVNGEGRVWVSGSSVTVSGVYNLNEYIGITEVSGGTVSFGSSAPMTTSVLNQRGGTMALNTSAPMNVGMLSQSGGAVSGGGDLIVYSSMEWTAGTQGGSGTTVVLSGARLAIGGGGAKYLNERYLKNYGSATWSGSGPIVGSNNAVLENVAGATFYVVNDESYPGVSTAALAGGDSVTIVNLDFTGGSNATFINAGALVKVGGALSTSMKALFYNSGTVTVQGGTLRLAQGPGSHSGAFTVAYPATLQMSSDQTLEAGSVVTGPGTVWVSAGTVTVAGAYNVSGTKVSGGTLSLSSGGPITLLTLEQSGGMLTGSDALTITSGFSWTGGTQTGSGTTTVAASAAFDLGGATKTLDGRTLNNQSVAFWTEGTVLLKNAATVNNSGIFDVESDFHLDQGSGDLSTFNNSGTFRKVGATETTKVEMHFNNAGSVEVLGGTLSLGYSGSSGSSSGGFSVGTGATLRFSNGSQALASSSSVSGGGRVWVSSGSVSVYGMYDLSGSTEVSGGTADFDSATAVAFANLTQSSGTLNVDNSVTISGDLIRNGGTFNAGTGTVAFTGTGEQSIGGSAATPFHSLTVNSGATVAIPAGANVPTVADTLTNNGTLKQTQDVDNSGGATDATFHFLNLKDGGGTDKYFGVDITIGAGVDMGSTDVYVRGNQTCSLPGSVKRCYELDPGDAGVQSTVRFYYRSAEANGNTGPFAWHWNGVSWDNVDPTPIRNTSNPEGYWVEVDEVSDYSPFALADGVTMIAPPIRLPEVIRRHFSNWALR